VDEPTYDVVDLDKKISRLAREIRKLDSAIKTTNALTEISNYNEPEEEIFDGPSTPPSKAAHLLTSMP